VTAAGMSGALPLPRLRDSGAARPGRLIRRGHSADRTTAARRFAVVFVAIRSQGESRTAADDWFADQRALAQTRRCPTLDLSALRQDRPASGRKRGAAPPAVRYSAAAGGAARDERQSGAVTLVIRTRQLRHLAVLGAPPQSRIDVSVISKHSG
jgi:hypothetical protein